MGWALCQADGCTGTAQKRPEDDSLRFSHNNTKASEERMQALSPTRESDPNSISRDAGVGWLEPNRVHWLVVGVGCGEGYFRDLQQAW